MENVNRTVPLESGICVPRSIGAEWTVPRTWLVNPVPVTVTVRPCRTVVALTDNAGAGRLGPAVTVDDDGAELTDPGTDALAEVAGADAEADAVIDDDTDTDGAWETDGAVEEGTVDDDAEVDTETEDDGDTEDDADADGEAAARLTRSSPPGPTDSRDSPANSSIPWRVA